MNEFFLNDICSVKIKTPLTKFPFRGQGVKIFSCVRTAIQ